MKTVAVFGAGLVAEPHIDYLLEHGMKVLVATRTLQKAKDMIHNHPNGEAIEFDIEKPDSQKQLHEIIKRCDVAVSLLPYQHHITIADACIAFKKHLVTTSYMTSLGFAVADPEKKKIFLKELDAKVKQAGVLFLMEIGLDPGIDHLSAMQIIDRVKDKGGKIKSFTSYCGGLPAPENKDTVPFNYKLSWSPRGVILAGTNTAVFRENGKEVTIPGKDLFANYRIFNVEGIEYEGYPNRDSLQYLDLYNIQDIDTLIRGTLRYTGWCDTWKKIADLGLLKDDKRLTKGTTYKQLMMQLINCTNPANVKRETAKFLALKDDSIILKKIDWLGLFSDKEIELKAPFSPLDAIEVLVRDKLKYAPGERDAVILQHNFIAEYPNGKKEQITSTLIDYGTPNGPTSMSRTVGLPSAIAARMISEGKIKDVGIHFPGKASIYEPILGELENLNIKMKEKVVPLKKESSSVIIRQ